MALLFIRFFMQLVLDQDFNAMTKEFEKLFSIPYLDTLEFSDDKALLWLKKCLAKKRKSKQFHIANRFTLALFENSFHQKAIPPLIIKQTNPLVGLGVFARKNLKPLTFIGQYSGVVRPRNKKADDSNDYVFRYVDSRFSVPYVIDAKDKGNLCRFLNHSDQPNLLSRSLVLGDSYHVIFYSKEPIKEGEQLTYDYGPYYWRKRANPLFL
ncbi:MAG: SET domain-containing protein [Rhabdochlamydiaceae bacterium]|nr:SET domain-containing protein [Candidatus Amphrikana amoebophyrae]